jgi:NAD(P)H-dependent FMN reductase
MSPPFFHTLAPSAIVSYSPGFFGGINAAQQLRLILAELGAPAIPSSFAISRVNEVFDDKGELVELCVFLMYLNGTLKH